MKILVIDPLSSGKDLVLALRAYEHVQVDEYYQESPFETELCDGSKQPEPTLVNLVCLGAYDVIVAGSEPGVSAADWLSNRFGLPCNQRELLWHRRNKQGMIDIAAEAGLKVPKTWTVRTVSGLLQLTDQLRNFTLGVIVKPAGSGGSDSCFICRDNTKVRDAVKQVLGSTNLFGIHNQEALVQERVGGEQYFVNAVSAEGRHLITEMFHYGISENSAVPHIYSAQTIAPDDPLFASGTHYVQALLDALGVRFGASHTEIRYADGVWTLIEYNGRSMGPTVPSTVYVPARGFSQISVLATCLVEGFEAAQRSVQAGSPDHCVGWHMPAPRRSGELHRIDWSPLAELDSYVGAYNEPEIGTAYDMNNRVTTASAGLLFFSHPTTAQVEQDISRSVMLEHADVFFSLI